MASFYDYFKENMESMGLPAPESLFGTLSAAVGTASTLLTQIDKFGKTVTLGELISAGTRLEKLAVIGACSAAFYVGAVIGSIAVATGRSLSGGLSIADVLAIARDNNLERHWLSACLIKFPGVYKPQLPGRRHYLNAKVVV
ncbi:hypothetical protein RAM80_17660 [Pseudomonas sp. App30]|uniref:hypothetical protein n=1 Tax=Pseudomonas sp. App30 TaxID=3068990 RepID=UPI003A8097B7